MTNKIQLISIARSQLGLKDEDTWRSKLINLVGESSLRKMTETQLEHVLTSLKRDGFQPNARSENRKSSVTLSGRFASPIRAFWLSGWNLGVFENNDDRAIIAFAHRQTGLEHVRFAVSDTHGRAIIEAIKAIVRRETGLTDLWRPKSKLEDWKNDGRVQVIQAQWHILGKVGAPMPSLEAFWPGARAAMLSLDGPVLIDLQRALGRQIRKVSKVKVAA